MKKKYNNGISLIALVVTIIILLILASISIATLTGDNGIISQAEESKELQEKIEIIESIKLKILAKEMYSKGGITQEKIEDILSNYGEIIKNDDGTIKSLKPENTDYEIAFKDLYDGTLPEPPEPEPSMAATPEKSDQSSFTRMYGVVEIEFLEGTSYTRTETPNAPILGNNMKKVYWEDNGTERVEGKEGFDETKWYNYIDQSVDTSTTNTSKWANAVTVDNNGNITGYFVWIPRYAYRIVYFDTSSHEDEYRSTGTTDGLVGYSDARGFVHPDGKTPSNMDTPATSIAVGRNKLRPHPAFENGSNSGYTQGEWNEALEGLWIAKYESSGTTTNLRSLPGVKALTSVNIGDMYTSALNFSATNKSHMLKNSEWGAMVYLADSKYGKNGNRIIANSLGLYSAGGNGATVKKLPSLSTTGNYYGIYDTGGASAENVSGYLPDCSTSYGNSFASNNPQSANATNDKTTSTEYATVYNLVSTSATGAQNYNANINKKFGDAIIEISNTSKGNASWGSADFSFGASVINTNKEPFFKRGGRYDDSNCGTFGCYGNNGAASSYSGFRLCLSIK